MLKKLLAIISSNVIISVIALLRNIIIARLLSPDDFGRGAVLALVVTFFEITSDVSVDKQIVQSKNGYSLKFLSNAHFVNLLRGVGIGFFIFVLSEPLALFFNEPALAVSFQILALVPVIKGLKHLCIVQRQREMDFSLLLKSELYPQLISLFLLYPGYLVFDDYHLFLVVIIANSVFNLFFTHVYSIKKYKLSFDRQIIYSMLRFGWPLLINGLVIFIVMQADRAVIGRWFGFETLGFFSAAFALTIMPVSIVSKILNTIFLPVLSRLNSNDKSYADIARFLLKVSFYIGVVYLVLFLTLGGMFYVLLYGEEYSEGAWFMSVLAISHAVRIFRIAPSLISLSEGKTVFLLYANFLRAIGFIFGALLVVAGFEILYLLVFSIFGEVLALILGCYLNSRFSWLDYVNSFYILMISLAIYYIYYLTDSYFLLAIFMFSFIAFSISKYRHDFVKLMKYKAVNT